MNASEGINVSIYTSMKYNSKGELGNFLWCLLLLQEKSRNKNNFPTEQNTKALCINFYVEMELIKKVFMSFYCTWKNIPSCFSRFFLNIFRNQNEKICLTHQIYWGKFNDFPTYYCDIRYIFFLLIKSSSSNNHNFFMHTTYFFFFIISMLLFWGCWNLMHKIHKLLNILRIPTWNRFAWIINFVFVYLFTLDVVFMLFYAFLCCSPSIKTAILFFNIFNLLPLWNTPWRKILSEGFFLLLLHSSL